MQLFQFIQMKWLLLGVGPNQYPLNRKILMGIFLYSVGISLCCLFISRVAQDFIELTNAIYQTTAMMFGAVCVTNFAFRMAKFFEFISSCERLVNKSKFNRRRNKSFYQVSELIQTIFALLRLISGLGNPTSTAIYTKVNQKIEKWTKTIHLFMVEVTAVLFIFPKLIMSYVLYYTTDTGGESFELPFPMW